LCKGSLTADAVRYVVVTHSTALQCIVHIRCEWTLTVLSVDV